jgi:small GTP-binding protein
MNINTPLPDWLERTDDDISIQRRSQPFKSKLRSYLSRKYLEEISKPPRIAIIGKASVGKSSTINALFKTHLRVGHTKTGTYAPQKINIDIDGKLIKGGKGDIVIYDMPGLGEDIDRTEQYIDIYLEILSRCDVAVWVISATDRSLAYDQKLLFEAVGNASKSLLRRLVIGINKIDLIHPNNWNKKVNLPSRAQERNFSRVRNRVIKQISKVCPELEDERFVLYSANQRYNLFHLFNVMLDACPLDRAWLLGERENIASYLDLVNPEYRKYLTSFEGN